MPAETAIRTFVTVAESYVAGLKGPGIAPVLDPNSNWSTLSALLQFASIAENC